MRLLGSGRSIGERAGLRPRTDEWRLVGLGSELDRPQAQRARVRLLILGLLIGGVLFVFFNRRELFTSDWALAIRLVTVLVLVVLGSALASELGRGLRPTLFRLMDPATAGTVGFVARVATIVVSLLAALAIAGLSPRQLALGGAAAFVIVGLAAQQTLGNLFAGVVLQANRPFRVGDRVRLSGGYLGPTYEGTVGSFGLFYTTLVRGEERTLIPNSLMLQTAIVPVLEPDRVELLARVGSETEPAGLREGLSRTITVPLRYPPYIALEELRGDTVVVRIGATPRDGHDREQLLGEVLAGVRSSSRRSSIEGVGDPQTGEMEATGPER